MRGERKAHFLPREHVQNTWPLCFLIFKSYVGVYEGITTAEAAPVTELLARADTGGESTARGIYEL